MSSDVNELLKSAVDPKYDFYGFIARCENRYTESLFNYGRR
jgi:hypothetical protein